MAEERRLNRRVKWDPYHTFWQQMHNKANRLAWKFGDPGGPDWGKAYRINHKNLWWRLNYWTAKHYVPWYLEQLTGKRPDNNERIDNGNGNS